MTQDDVIRITRSLSICELTSKSKQAIHYSLTIHNMLNLFKVVATEERERMIYAGPHEWAKEALLLEREACADPEARQLMEDVEAMLKRKNT